MPTDAMETILALAAAHAVITRSLEVAGLSFAELRLLLALLGSDAGRRPTELAHDLQLSPSGVTRALLPLEKRGIVERKRDPGDGRASHVFLTRAGRELVDEAVKAASERGSRLLRRLSVGQTKQLQRLLEEIGR